MKTCVEAGCTERQHARSRCFDHWVALCAREARSISKTRRRAAQAVRERTLFLEARKARLAGDRERRAFILKSRKLPEEVRPERRGQKTFRGQSIDRTFVSDIALDAGDTNWHGYDYFGDVQFPDWPEREKLGIGGRNTSRKRKK